MICGGDEIGRTQNGNNNAYCQDNEISWIDWDLDERKARFLDFTTWLIELRRAHPNFRRKKFFQDRGIRYSEIRDIAWYRTDGHEMTEQEWSAPWVRSMGLMLNGGTMDAVNELGEPDTDSSFLILFNSYHEGVQFTLPASPESRGWEVLMSTCNNGNSFAIHPAGSSIIVSPRSLVLLQERGDGELPAFTAISAGP